MEIKLYDGMYSAGVFDSAFTFPEIKVTAKRTVTCYELEFFAENGGVTYINGQHYQIRKNAILFAKPGDVRFTELPLRAYYLKIDADCSLSHLFCGMQSFFIGAETETVIYLIKKLLATPNKSTLARHSLFLSIIDLILTENTNSMRYLQIPAQKSREAVGLGIEYMEKNFREKCNLKDIATFAHFSPVYFHGIFKLATGKTPYEYLFTLRIEEAKRLLMTENLGMTEIAERCGFTSQSYFNYSFKKETGQTPSEYRRRMLEMYLSENGEFKRI